MHKKSHLSPAGKAMWAAHKKQSGGSWGSFISAIKGAANTVYNKAILPAYRTIRDKPISAAATAAGFIPGVGKVLSPILGATGFLTGKGAIDYVKPYATEFPLGLKRDMLEKALKAASTLSGKGKKTGKGWGFGPDFTLPSARTREAFEKAKEALAIYKGKGKKRSSTKKASQAGGSKKVIQMGGSKANLKTAGFNSL